MLLWGGSGWSCDIKVLVVANVVMGDMCVVGCSCGRCSFTWGILIEIRSRIQIGCVYTMDSNPDSDHLSPVGCDPDSGHGFCDL